MGLFDFFKKKEQAPSPELLERRRKCAELARIYVSDEDYSQWLNGISEEQREFLAYEVRTNYHVEDQNWGERFIIRVLHYFNERETMSIEWNERMEKYQEERRGQTIEKHLPGYDPAEFVWLDEEKKALDALSDEILNHTNELKRLYGQWPEEFDRIGTIPYINDKK